MSGLENPFRNYQCGPYQRQFRIPTHVSNRKFVSRPQRQGPGCVPTAVVCYSLIQGALQCPQNLIYGIEGNLESREKNLNSDQERKSPSYQ